MSEVNCWPENEDLQRQEQVIWQIETNDTNRSSVLDANTSTLLHQLPLTYLTAENQNIVLSKGRKSLTYIVSQNLDDSQKLQKIDKNRDVFLQDPQKVMVVQSLDSKFENSVSYTNMGQMTVNYVGAKVYKVDDCGRGAMYFSSQNSECVKSEYEIVEGHQIQGDVSVGEINEISNSEEIEDLDIKISGEKELNAEDNQKVVKKPRKQKDEVIKNGEEKDIFFDQIKTSELLDKGKKTGKNKVEKKVL